MRILILIAALILFGAAHGTAQTPTGAVEGVVHSADDGTPIPFAIIRLLPAVSQLALRQGALTDSAGRFLIASVPSGDYRLQVERIGYERVISLVVHVAPGATLRHDIRAAAAPVQLAAVSILPDGTCLTATQLAQDPRLTTIWNEAKKGVDARRAFELQYRFTRNLKQDIKLDRRFRADTRTQRDETSISEPDSVVDRDRRRQAANRADGYAKGNSLSLPDEKELLDDDFLRAHCLETTVAQTDSALGLRFRPAQPRHTGTSIRGTIWVDATTYLIRRLEIEHLNGDRALAETSVDYADVSVTGSTLRLPSTGRVALHTTGPLHAIIPGATDAFAYAYRGFELVRSK